MPSEVEVRPCYIQPKINPKLDIKTSTVNCDFAAAEFDHFAWLICRAIGSSLEAQKVPSWTGWLSQTSTEKESIVEYLAPLNELINENSTVQYILKQSLAASHEVGQEYAIVTFDLAVAKKAYALVWQYYEKFSKVILRMGVFHTICSLFGTLGKMTKGSGLSEIIIESGICANGSLDRVMNGKHFNRAVRIHKLVLEALERLLFMRFEEEQPQNESISDDTFNMLQDLTEKPGAKHLAR